MVVYNDSSKNNDFLVSGWIIDELSVVDLISGQRLGIFGSPIPFDVSISVAAYDSFSCLSISTVLCNVLQLAIFFMFHKFTTYTIRLHREGSARTGSRHVGICLET